VRNASLVGLNASPALGVTALAGAFTSYKCLDAATYLAVFEGRSYPSGDAVALCALYRVTATTWAVAAAPLSGGRCPDVADLPPAPGAAGAAALATGGAYADSAFAVRVATAAVPTPSPLVCVNSTGPPAAAPAFAEFAAPPGESPCAALPAELGASTIAGLWLGGRGGAEDAVLLDAGTAWGVVSFARGAPLAVRRGEALEHECLAPGEVATASEFQEVSANGTGAIGFECRVQARTGADSAVTRVGAGEGEAAAGGTFEWAAIPGADVALAAGTPTCAVAAPAAAPAEAPASAPASAAPRALAAVAAATALLALA
jgi:hypothetical protein